MGRALVLRVDREVDLKRVETVWCAQVTWVLVEKSAWELGGAEAFRVWKSLCQRRIPCLAAVPLRPGPGGLLYAVRQLAHAELHDGIRAGAHALTRLGVLGVELVAVEKLGCRDAGLPWPMPSNRMASERGQPDDLEARWYWGIEEKSGSSQIAGDGCESLRTWSEEPWPACIHENDEDCTNMALDTPSIQSSREGDWHCDSLLSLR